MTDEKQAKIRAFSRGVLRAEMDEAADVEARPHPDDEKVIAAAFQQAGLRLPPERKAPARRTLWLGFATSGLAAAGLVAALLGRGDAAMLFAVSETKVGVGGKLGSALENTLRPDGFVQLTVQPKHKSRGPAPTVACFVRAGDMLTQIKPCDTIVSGDSGTQVVTVRVGALQTTATELEILLLLYRGAQAPDARVLPKAPAPATTDCGPNCQVLRETVRWGG